MNHNAETDLVEFELGRILALGDLVISYSYIDDSIKVMSIPLRAFMANDELWILLCLKTSQSH